MKVGSYISSAGDKLSFTPYCKQIPGFFTVLPLPFVGKAIKKHILGATRISGHGFTRAVFHEHQFPVSIQSSGNTSRKVENSPATWVPANHVGELHGALAFWLLLA